MIFNIQRFSTHDGQGIRTMIFYKGCPLRCEWCCNPESQAFRPSLMFDKRLCKDFRDCLKIDSEAITLNIDGIHIDRLSIKNPEKFRDTCASRALIVSGEDKSVELLLAEIEKDFPFYNRSEGGVTLSGGEPLSQGPELDELLQELKKRNMDISIETSLHIPWKMIERYLGLSITFLADLKHIDSEKFNRFTGGKLDLVLNNLRKLAACNEKIIIRVPVIPEFNHSIPEMKKIIRFAASLPAIREIHFLPYHKLGIEKYNMLGMEYIFGNKPVVEVSELDVYIDYAVSLGLIAKVGG